MANEMYNSDNLVPNCGQFFGTGPTAAIEIEEDDDVVMATPDGGKKVRRKLPPRAEIWNHYTKLKDDPDHATCNYCGSLLACHAQRNGTSSLNNHVRSCKHHPSKISGIQTELNYQDNADGPFGTCESSHEMCGTYCESRGPSWPEDNVSSYKPDPKCNQICTKFHFKNE